MGHTTGVVLLATRAFRHIGLVNKTLEASLGSIIIASMQAQLTLDKRDFDANADAAEKRIASLQALGKSLPGAQSSNVGKDATQDPAAQQRQIERVQQAQDFATQQTQQTQLAALASAGASDQENAHRRSKAAFQDLVQAQLQGYQQIGAAADVARQKAQAIHQATQTAVAPTVSQVGQLTHWSTQHTSPPTPGVTYLDRDKMLAEAHAHRLATAPPVPTTPGPRKGPWENSYAGMDSYQDDEAERAKAEAYIARLKANPPPPKPPGSSSYPSGFVPSGVSIADAGLPQAPASTLTADELDERVRAFMQANPGLSAQDAQDIYKSIMEGDKGHGVISLPGPAKPKTQAAPTARSARRGRGAPEDPLAAQLAAMGIDLDAGENAPRRSRGLDDFSEGESNRRGEGGLSQFFPWFKPAARGEGQSIRYQTYEARESFGMGLATRAVEPFSPQLAQGLIAFAGPELAAITAVTAFTAAIKLATDAAMAMQKAQFQLTYADRGSGLEVGGVNAGFNSQQTAAMQALGFGNLDETGALTSLERFTQSPATISRIQRESADTARALNLPLAQVQQMYISSQQGDSSAFHQYLPQIYGDTPLSEVEKLTQKQFGGAAAAYAATPAGEQAKLQADIDKNLADAGNALVPVVDAITKALDAMLPVIKPIADGLGTLGSVIGTVISALEGPFGWAMHQGGSSTQYPSDLRLIWPQSGPPGPVVGGRDQAPDVHPLALPQTFRMPALGQGGTFTPTINIPGVTPPGTAGVTGQGATGGTGDTAQNWVDSYEAQISAITRIQDEVAKSQQAITGMTDVFAKLTVFHIDFRTVQGNLDNMAAGLKYLQTFWSKVVADSGEALQGNAYKQVDIYVNMVNNMLTMMGSASDTFTKVYETAGEMPTQQQVDTVLTRMSVAFNVVNPIAQLAMKGTSASGQGVMLAFFKEYTDTMSSLVTFLNGSADALTKVFDMPIPSPATVARGSAAIVGLIKTVSVDLVGAFYSTVGQYVGNGQVQISQSIDPLLGQAGAVATNAEKMMTFANSGIDAISKMRDISIPSQGEIDTIVHRLMGMSSMVGAALNKQLAAPRMADEATGNVMQALGLPNIPGLLNAVGAGGTASADADATMKAASVAAENQTKLLQFVGAGVSALAGMRDLSIPSQGFVDNVVQSSVLMVQHAVEALPPVDGTALTKMKDYGEALAPMMQAVGSGVSALASMRDLAEPSQGQMNKVLANVLSIGSVLGSAAQQFDGTQTDKMRDFGNGLNAELGALSTGADVLKKIRELPVPSGFSLVNFKAAFDQVDAQFTPEAMNTAQSTTDRMKDWGNGMGPMMTALSAGVDFLTAAGKIIVPTHQQLDSIWDAQSYMADKAKHAAGQIGPELSVDIQKSGEAMSAAFGAMNAGGDFLQKVVAQPPMPKSMIDKYFSMLGEATTEFSAGMHAWVSNQDLENAKYAPELQSELDAMTAGTDFLFKLGTLKPDYSAAINGYFAQLNLAVPLFQTELAQWQKGMTAQTGTLATNVKTEMDALNSALDPFTKMETASQIRPEQIELAFTNSKMAMQKFLGLMNSPELQGDKLGGAVNFSKNVTEIFGAMKTTVDAVDVLNQPGYQTNSGTFGQVMSDFFLKAVPLYASAWSKAMQSMGDDSETMAGRSISAIGSTQPAAFLPSASKSIVAANRSAGAAGGGNSYTNCIIIGNDLIASDPGVAKLIQDLTKNNTIKAGGLPVGNRR